MQVRITEYLRISFASPSKSYLVLVVSLWLLLMFLTAFDFLHVAGGVILSFVVLASYWIIFFCRSGLFFPPRLQLISRQYVPIYMRAFYQLKEFGEELKRKTKLRPLLFGFVLIFAFVLAFLSCYFLFGFCVCGVPDEVSTYYTRTKMETTCRT